MHSVTSGVPQGSILGPLLFSIYLDPLTKISLSQDTTLILYADDIVPYRPISSSHDIDVFQSDVDNIADWVKDAGLRLNANKSKVVVFSHKQSRPAVIIKVDNTAVPVADSTCFLGVTITSDLNWNTHVSNTCAKARQQLGIIHRTFNQSNSNTLSHLYRCLVLPTLDYCSSGTLTQAFQRLAVKMVTKHWSASSTHMLSTHPLNLCPPQEQRWKQKATVCARILRGCSVIPPLLTSLLILIQANDSITISH